MTVTSFSAAELAISRKLSNDDWTHAQWRQLPAAFWTKPNSNMVWAAAVSGGAVAEAIAGTKNQN
jgi:hypothetical protein